MNKATQEAVQNAETIMKDAQSAYAEAFEKAKKSLDDAGEFSKANFDAIVKSSELSSKSAEKLSQEVANIAKKNFDETVKASQDLAAAKTVTELFEKQTAFAKSAFETYSEQFKVISELATTSAKEAFAPIQERAEKTGELAKSFQV